VARIQPPQAQRLALPGPVDRERVPAASGELGLAFASAINSFTDLAGTDGCTETASGTIVTRLTGAKSRSVS
jgi:hypothetical protein